MFSLLRLRSTIAFYFLLSISVILAFAFLVPSACAQESETNELAARFAKELNKKYGKSVVVFDFVGPDKKITALGQKIATDFRESLSRSPAAFIVTAQSRIAEALTANRFSLRILNDPDIELWLARKLGPGIMVLGTLEREADSLHISVHSYRVVDGKAINGFKITLPLTEQMRTLLDTPAEDSEDQYRNIPTVLPNGYSSPKCVYCPTAHFTDLAVKKHTQGTVFLRIVVGTDGKAHDINVLKSLPNGLTGAAIEAVRSWTFEAGTDQHGLPVAQSTTVEVTFNLFN
jgi:TonB family protein